MRSLFYITPNNDGWSIGRDCQVIATAKTRDEAITLALYRAWDDGQTLGPPRVAVLERDGEVVIETTRDRGRHH